MPPAVVSRNRPDQSNSTPISLLPMKGLIMNPLNRSTVIMPRPATTPEQELTTFSERCERIDPQPRATMKQELDTFFAGHALFLPSDLVRLIAGYADENGVLAMRNSQRKISEVQFDSHPYREEIGAIMCALSASPNDFASVHKQIMLSGFARGGLGELVKIFNEMSRIKEKANINYVKFKGASLIGPCNLNYLSATGVEFTSVRFENFQLRGANFNESVLHSVAFIDVDLRNACLAAHHWENVGFQNVDITGLNTSDQRLVRFMEEHQKKKPGARVILNGLLDFHGLTLETPKPSDRKCSVM